MLAALCSVLFLGPALLPGRALVPYPVTLFDVQHSEAVQRGEPVELRGSVAMGDKYNQSLCWDRVLQDRLRQGEWPRWTRDIAGGAAFVPQMAQVWQPWNLLLLIVPAAQWYGLVFLLHQVLFGWLCYRFLRQLGCSDQAALLGLSVAVLGLWTQSKLHHNVILTGALSVWPMLSAIHRLCRLGGTRRTAAALAIWTGLSWLSGFVVVSLQASVLGAAFALVLCLGNAPGRRLRPLLWCGLGLLLGGLLALAQMLPVLLAAAESARPPGDATALLARSLEGDHLLSLLWPDLLHQANDVFYGMAEPTRPPWLSQLVLLHDGVEGAGHSFVECSFAVGLPALLAALLALLPGGTPRRGAWFFGAVLLFALGLACGQWLCVQLGRLVPQLTATDLKRNLFTAAMALTVLAGLGADRLRQPRAPRLAIVLLLGIAVLSAGGWIWCLRQDAESFTDAIAALVASDADHPQVLGQPAAAIAAWMRQVAYPGEAAANLAMLETTFLRAFLVALAAAAALRWLPAGRRLPVLIGLGILELLHAGRPGVVAVPAASVTTPPAVVAPVLAAPAEAPGVRGRFWRLGRPDDRRVKALYPPNLPGFHHLEDVAAYNPLPPARMEEFWLCAEPDERDAQGALQKTSVVYGGAGVGWARRPATLAHPLLDLFGVRWILTDQTLADDVEGLVDRTPAGAAPPFRLYERTTTMPRATFVSRVRLLPDRLQRLAALADPGRDPALEIVLEDPTAPQVAGGASTPAVVTIVEHRDEQVTIRVNTDHQGFLRLADPWDAGWTATRNGEPTRVYVADHHLRAVWLPAGEHEVVFRYDGFRAVWPLRLSLLALLGILLLAFLPRRAR